MAGQSHHYHSQITIYLRAGWQLLRPRVVVTLLLFAFLGSASASGQVLISWRLLLFIACLAFMYMNATAINDLADEEIDKINLKQAAGRPLVRMTATRRQVTWLAMSAGILALAASLFLGARLTGLVALGIIFNVAYSLPPVRISYRGILAPLLLPVGYVLIPFTGAVLLTGHSIKWQWLAVCYTAFMGRMTLKDIRDIAGDTRYGKRTFVVRYGKTATYRLTALLWLLADAFLAADLSDLKLWLFFQLPIACVVHCLRELARTSVKNEEQLWIGLLARQANAIAIALLAYFVTVAGYEQSVSVAVLTVGSAALHVWAVTNFDKLTIGYRG